MTCENQISTQNLIDAKDDSVTLGEVATSREGAESGGAPITQATNRFGEVTDTVQGRLNKIGVIFDDPIRDWSASLLVSDLRAHRYPATTGDIYIPVKPLPFTTGGSFNTSDWVLLQGLNVSDLSTYTALVFTTAVSMQAGISGIAYVIGDALKVQGENDSVINYSVVSAIGAAAPDLLLTGGLYARPQSLTIPKKNDAGFSDPIIRAPLLGGTEQKWWTNYFSQNFVIGDGGGSLTDAASGTKDGNNNQFMGFGIAPNATSAYACDISGYNGASSLTIGSSLTGSGYQNLFKATSAENGVAIGTDCGFTITTAKNFALVGRHIGFDGVAEWIGDNNAILGMDNVLKATTLNAMSIVGIFAQQEGTISARSVVNGFSAAQLANQVDDSVISGNGTTKNVTGTILKTVEIGARTNENAFSLDRNANIGYNSFFTLSTPPSATNFNATVGAQTALNTYGVGNYYGGYRAGAQIEVAGEPVERNGIVCIGHRAGDGHAADGDLIIANTNSVANALINGNFTSRVLQLEGTEVTFKNLPTYADNAAALAGSHPVGADYKTATGERRVVV